MSEAIAGWSDEMRSAYLYRILARVEKSPERAALFGKLADEAEAQGRIWAEGARSRGLEIPSRYHADRRTRIVAHLVQRVGPRPMRGVLAAMKVRGLSVYGHAVPGHPVPTSIDDMAARHRSVGAGGNLRAAVFGANDGLVSNCCLILGVAGAGAASTSVTLSGVAGLLAGAFSMATGEYVSVRSQREMFEHQISLERKELETYPGEEAEELALIYAARGLSDDDAHMLATKMIASPERALDTLAREELGLNPDELGSPWRAAVFSFISFATGAAVPLLPFLIGAGNVALLGCIGLTAASLFVLGVAVSLFTGRSALANGARMLFIGAAAGTATYFIGKLLGVALG